MRINRNCNNVIFKIEKKKTNLKRQNKYIYNAILVSKTQYISPYAFRSQTHRTVSLIQHFVVQFKQPAHTNILANTNI